jgi:hypothetical protein
MLTVATLRTGRLYVMDVLTVRIGRPFYWRAAVAAVLAWAWLGLPYDQGAVLAWFGRRLKVHVSGR